MDTYLEVIYEEVWATIAEAQVEPSVPNIIAVLTKMRKAMIESPEQSIGFIRRIGLINIELACLKYSR